MITFEPAFELDTVRDILTHPRIYPHITDDHCPPVEQFQPTRHESLLYLMVRHAGSVLGLFMFVPQNGICYEVHTCLLPIAWGRFSIRAARGAAEWMFSNTAALRIITNVPRYNTLAFRLAQAAGMKQFGVNERSFLKNGVLHDQIMLGLSKEAN